MNGYDTMETDQLNGIAGTQETAIYQDSDMHSQNESPATDPKRVIADCLDDLAMTTALPHNINQALDEQSTREQRPGSTNTQISHHRHQDSHRRAFPPQPSQRPRQFANPHHIRSQHQVPTLRNRSHAMAKDSNAEDWNSKYTYDMQNSGHGQPQSQMHTTFPPTDPQLHNGSFNVGMNQAASHPSQTSVGPYSNQQQFSQYASRENQAQPNSRGAPNGYTDLQTCRPYPYPASQEHLFHTGHQNKHPGPSRGSQQFTSQTTGASPWEQYGYDQNRQVTASPEVVGYHQNHQPRGYDSDQSSHPQYNDYYQDQPFQQSIGKHRHGNYQQHTHHRAPVESEDNEIFDGEVSQYNDDGSDGDHFNDDNIAKTRGTEDGDNETIDDSIFGEDSAKHSRSPERNFKHLSPREKSQLFVHGSDDDAEDGESLRGDNKNETLQARRHRKVKDSSANDNHSGSGGVPRGATAGFTMPGTASEYLPSRYSGAPIPKSMPNMTPKTKNGRYISDASLRKRGLNRVQKNRVPKRAAGANDPENIKIVQLYDNDGIRSYDEIAEMINDDRRKQGRAPDLTGCAVSARYTRTAPILYKAEGKVWVPPSQRKGPMTGPASVWNEDLDLRLVSIKQEIDATTWQQVTNRFNQETGNHLTIEQISTRYAAI